MLGWELRDSYMENEYQIICGCDEAGRGCLAGRVYAAAVIFRDRSMPDGLDDSKRLSEKKREYIFEQITSSDIDYSVAFCEHDEIDEMNILEASLLAMKKAVLALRTQPGLILVDGNIARGFEQAKAVPVIKGDGLIPEIAAASVLAKVSRDRYCLELEEMYPGYGFAVHKGYATAIHRKAIREKGACPVHRKTFLGKILLEPSNEQAAIR